MKFLSNNRWWLLTLMLFYVFENIQKVQSNPVTFSKETDPTQDPKLNNNDCPYHPKPVHLTEQDLERSINGVLETVAQYIKEQVDPTVRPAISANLVYKDEIIWESNFGQISKTNSTPPTGDTIYRIASISKIFPTLFLFKLWDDGLLSLDDWITMYAHNFSIGYPFFDFSRIQLTLFDIASQISGLPRSFPFDILKQDTFAWNGTFEQALDVIRNEILVVEPRTTCHYSNLAYALLAHVLERNFSVENDFEKWAQKNIVEFLDLKNTGFILSDHIKTIMAQGYLPTGQKADLYDLNWFRPAGNYYSSARDLAAITMSLMETSNRKLLSHKATLKIFEPVLKCGYGYLSEYTGTPWEVNEQQSYQVIRKDGDIQGYSSTMAMIPPLDLSFNLLMSGTRSQDIAGVALDKIIPAFVSTLRRKPVQLTPALKPSRYIGLYQVDNIQYWNVTTDSSNRLTMTNPYTPESPFKTVGLNYVSEGVLQLSILGGLYPCVVGNSNLDLQNDALLHFKNLTDGVYNQFDMPGLNVFGFKRNSK